MPLLNKEILSDGTILYIWSIEESESELIAMIPDFNRYESQFLLHKSGRRRLEFLAVRVLMSIGSPGSDICYHASGKPFLDDEKYYVSISHSGKFVAIMLNSSKPIALDIEVIADKASRLHQRFLSLSELPETRLTDQEFQLYCVLCWSAKESVFKYIDKEGVDFRDNIKFTPFTLNSYCIESLVKTSDDKNSHLHINFRIYDAFVMSYIN